MSKNAGPFPICRNSEAWWLPKSSTQPMSPRPSCGRPAFLTLLNKLGRYPIPQLELSMALLDGWVRFWYQEELLPLPAELQQSLDEVRERLGEANRRVEEQTRRAEESARQAEGQARRAEAAEREAERLRAEVAELQSRRLLEP